jgi:flavin-dependent dehydrogenase
MKRMSKATILNGLTANAKEYNRRADILDRELRDLAARTRFRPGDTYTVRDQAYDRELRDQARKASAEAVLRHELCDD